MPRVRRLHLQFYLAILATLAVFVVVIIVFWNLPGTSANDMWTLDRAAQLADTLLPPVTASHVEQQRAVEELRQRLRMDFALYDSHGQLMSGAGYTPPVDLDRLKQKHWMHSNAGPIWILPLSD